jgi:hypothetical protein
MANQKSEPGGPWLYAAILIVVLIFLFYFWPVNLPVKKNKRGQSTLHSNGAFR